MQNFETLREFLLGEKKPWEKREMHGPTPAGDDKLLTRVTHTDYPSGEQVAVSRKKRNILQPVLSNSFSPSRRKLSNPGEVFNMESPTKRRRVKLSSI